MGIGGLVALAAIAIVVLISAPISLSLIAATAIAAAATATGLVTAGTMALNSHYDRPLTTNIVSNVLRGAGTALVISGLVLGGMLFCATPTGAPICGAVPPVLDTVEQVSLQIQLAYEVAIGDPHAGETAIELQLELNDGGVPGNSLAPEISEQLAKLGDDVPELLAIYGSDIIPLLIKYEDNAVDIIGVYGDEGVSLLIKYGDDTPQAIKIVREYVRQPLHC